MPEFKSKESELSVWKHFLRELQNQLSSYPTTIKVRDGDKVDGREDIEGEGVGVQLQKLCVDSAGRERNPALLY